MTKETATTKYCTVPPNTVACGHDPVTHSFYAITRPHDVSLKIIITSGEAQFFQKFCVDCSYYCSKANVVKQMTELGIMSNNSNLINHCEQNKLCFGSVDQQKYCFANNKLQDGSEVVEFTLPHLLWVWSYKAKGKMTWRLYYVNNFQSEDTVLDIYPYLIPNIYDNPAGTICWRKPNGLNKTPKDLVEGYYTFLDAPFNRETLPANVEDVLQYLKDYDPLTDERSTKSQFSLLSINNWFVGSDCPDTMLYTNDPEIINTFPKRAVQAKEMANSLFVRFKDTDNPNMFIANVNGYQCLKIGKLKGKVASKLLFSP